MSRLQHNIQPSLALGSTVEGNKLVTLTGFDFERHKHIIGISGSGKSSFLASCAILLLKQGVPFTLIDPHGDLCKLILSLLASSDFFRNPKAYDRLWVTA
jgi:DNA helicase HerA-like ATPase